MCSMISSINKKQILIPRTLVYSPAPYPDSSPASGPRPLFLRPPRQYEQSTLDLPSLHLRDLWRRHVACLAFIFARIAAFFLSAFFVDFTEGVPESDMAFSLSLSRCSAPTLLFAEAAVCLPRCACGVLTLLKLGPASPPPAANACSPSIM
eukprot:329697-Rhodomonas_salina.1